MPDSHKVSEFDIEALQSILNGEGGKIRAFKLAAHLRDKYDIKLAPEKVQQIFAAIIEQAEQELDKSRSRKTRNKRWEPPVSISQQLNQQAEHQ